MGGISNRNNYCVYIHTNKVNGKMYVGQTFNIKERWRCSGKNYFASVKFFNAIKKYGWDAFNHAVIKDNLSREEADALEKELIKKYDTIKNGYNLKEGGSRGELSLESLKKMGEGVHKAFTEHPEIKEKIRKKALGRRASEEAKKKMMLNSKKALFITIDGESRNIRSWAKKIGMTHSPLIYRKNKYGIDNLIAYIKQKINNRAA